MILNNMYSLENGARTFGNLILNFVVDCQSTDRQRRVILTEKESEEVTREREESHCILREGGGGRNREDRRERG
jgi:hypothetical protein